MKFRNPIATMILIVLLTFTLAACAAPKNKAPDAQALQGFIGADGNQPDGSPPNPNAAPPEPAAEQPSAADAPQDGASADAAPPESAGGESITRTYTFPDTNRSIPYRVYLPAAWTAEQSLPLVVILHGRGQDENSLLDGGPEDARGIVAKLAEQYNFIVAAPLGYARSGSYGMEQTKPQDGMPAAGQMGGGPGGGGQGGPPDGGQPPDGGGQPPADGQGGPGGSQTGHVAQEGAQGGAAAAEKADDLSEEERANLVTYSEQDVLNVVSLVSQEFNVDTTRVFLTGTGSGGDGTMHLATKYPDLWLAIAPSEGGFDVTAYEASLPALKIKGAMLVQSGSAAAADGQPSGGQPAAEQGADGQASAGGPPAGRAGMRQVSAEEMLEKLTSMNVDARSVTIENARPSEAWFSAAEQIFAFFDAFARQ